MTNISFLRLDSRAIPPTRARVDDAGHDLCTIESVSIAPGERASVGTGLAIAIPVGCAGLVLPRSGHAARHGITVVNAPGLIDSGYRGEVKVLLINHGTDHVVYAPGDRIAQLVIIDIPPVTFHEVDQLDHTDRGIGGFGSTGR
ncbi:MAG: dUTP diphosphatase [Acidimicrobiia bacterium]